MTFIDYLIAVIKKAAPTPWRLAEAITCVIGIVGAALISFFPKTATYINLATWVFPLVLMTILLLCRLFLAPYWLIKEEKAVSAKYKHELVAIEQASPNVFVDSIKQAQLYNDSQFTKDKRPIFETLQVWFKNHPIVSNEHSFAKHVSAEIDFTSANESEFSLHVYGQWAVNNPPNFVGSAELSSTVDIPPGALPVKLNIALKYNNDSSAYAYSLEGLKRDPDGRDVVSEIPPGKYSVTVKLQGIRIDHTYLFELFNPGVGATLSLKAS